MNPREKYPARPIFVSQDDLASCLEFRNDGSVVFRPHIVHELDNEEIIVPQENIFSNIIPMAIDGLLEDLVPGSELGEAFQLEWERCQQAFLMDEKIRNYGVWFYYPFKNHLVQYLPEFWHRLALVVRNSTLLRANFTQSWVEMRNIFENTVIAVAGASVGFNALWASVSDLRPKHVKIADQRDFKLTNANRVVLGYEDLGRNKASVAAEKIHAIDPFIRISAYPEGIHADNVDEFVGGNPISGEPKATVVVDEMDHPDMKILLREIARKYTVPVVMVTDIGSAIQIDIRRFDLDSNISLAYGILDKELYAKRDAWKKDLANRNKFYAFAWALIGQNYKTVAEFRRIVDKEELSMFVGVPQLGSTAAAAGGIAAENIARMVLGEQRPERIFINKNTGGSTKGGAK